MLSKLAFLHDSLKKRLPLLRGSDAHCSTIDEFKVRKFLSTMCEESMGKGSADPVTRKGDACARVLACASEMPATRVEDFFLFVAIYDFFYHLVSDAVM